MAGHDAPHAMRCVRCPAWLSRRNAAAAARATAGRPARKKHWEEGGHDKLCKKIKKGGGAEQYRANKKYVEAVAVATEACAEDIEILNIVVVTCRCSVFLREGHYRLWFMKIVGRATKFMATGAV